jgi:hypothetical protein
MPNIGKQDEKVRRKTKTTNDNDNVALRKGLQ